MEVTVESDSKQIILNDNTICRCCLSVDKPVKPISMVSYFYQEISGIKEISDAIPPWICTECKYLLDKCVKFKHKIVKAHKVLNDYLTRCAPFPIDAQDPELKKYATCQLAKTEILQFDTLADNNIMGFHPVYEHTKVLTESPLNIQVFYPTIVKDETVKQEDSHFSDYEDDIPLQEYSRNKEELTIEEFKDLLVKSEEFIVKTKKRKKRTQLSSKKTKKEKREEEIDLNEKDSVRPSIDIDPTKIIYVKLNLEQQIELRKQLSTDEKYLRCPYKCDLCYKGFNHEAKLKNHMKKHSPSRGKYKCKLCLMYLPTPYSYKVHELTHSTRYECVKCGRKMVDKMSMVRHYSSEHEGLIQQYTCTICHKVSHNERTHRGHMRNHHSGIRPKCEQCGKTFVNNDSLNDHMLIHKGVKNYTCEKCGAKFRTKNQVVHHQVVHSTSKDFYCVECDSRFKTELNLRQHLMKSLKHRDKSTLKFECPRCPARLPSASSLQHHLSYQHDGLRLHTCPHCGKALATANSLAKHVRYAHLGITHPRKHVCDACGKAFTSKNILVNHVRTHTGEKPFECEYCGRKFSQRSAKHTHVNLVHLKIKRNSKMKDIEDLSQNHKLIPKEEDTAFESWKPSDEIYFTVTTGS